MSNLYSGVAKRVSRWCGRPSTFLLAVGIIVVWIVTGPIFGFSDTWQLVINTGTTIVTFLMVFLIQILTNPFCFKLKEISSAKKLIGIWPIKF